MTGSGTRDNGERTDRATGRGWTWRRATALLLAAAGLSGGAAVATAGSAAAAGPCASGAVLFGNICIAVGYPAPTTPPVTTTPTTAAPLVSLPPVTLPPVTLPPAATPGPATAVADAAQRLLDLANGERQRAGLGQLTSREDIAAIALAHSQEMAQAGDIFHSTSFFASAVKNLLNAGVRGENVAYNSDLDVAHARLMASAGHRANLMNPSFSAVGFAVVRAADGRYFITQDFIQPAGAPRVAAAPRAPAPAAARTAAAPRPAPASTVAPAPTTLPPPTTTVAPPAPSPTVPVASTLPVVRLGAGSSAISATSAHRSGRGVTPLAASAVALLIAALCACCVVPRRLGR